MFSNFRPINDFVLVELVEKDTKTSGGIIIPDQAQEKNQQAKVIHAGKSEQVKSGDMVYYKKYFGTALNDKLTVLKEEEILGVL
jgi:chaperonin GroES